MHVADGHRANPVWSIDMHHGIDLKNPFTMSKTATHMAAYSLYARSTFVSSIGLMCLVEPIGIEPMTPCLQSRCSPS